MALNHANRPAATKLRHGHGSLTGSETRRFSAPLLLRIAHSRLAQCQQGGAPSAARHLAPFASRTAPLFRPRGFRRRGQ